MSEQVELNELIDNPAARRLWLFHRALQSLPFDEAIELASTAEAFITGSPTKERHIAARVDGDASEVSARSEQLSEETLSDRAAQHPTVTKRTRLELSSEHREQLLDRLAQGAQNTALAAEFGISSKQVQGLRIGCAREIAERRDRLAKEPAQHDATSLTTSVEEIIRYLRQQDDVVVPQEDGSYLINGRFRMSLAELSARANRMRRRQRKPAFELRGEQPNEKNSSVNGHPLFWEQLANSQPRS